MNPLSNKFLGLFVILVVMLATLTASSPIPELDKRTPVLHVSAPGPGRRAIKSIQNVSWWCNECSSTDKVIIKVKDARGTFVTLTGHNANSGTKDFVIDPSWARPGFTYFVEVFLKKNPSINGVSNSFEVFATKG
ncbi:371_t:CDS:2 [Paraglomus occultum]|uniref:371_t:CDS:1 n=1 Tax=Paraglomus occultum TaxID=144539 RepID=A0A9N9B4I4_9GLOM|nr:371_t:CDS:2 [Paraglomus occultum]